MYIYLLQGILCNLQQHVIWILLLMIIIILMSWVRHKTERGCGVSTWDNEVALCHNYLRVTLEQGVVPVNSPRGHEVPGWRPAGDSLSHG